VGNRKNLNKFTKETNMPEGKVIPLLGRSPAADRRRWQRLKDQTDKALQELEKLNQQANQALELAQRILDRNQE
jgi:geranylgeranyl pyrophosphate synthase